MIRIKQKRQGVFHFPTREYIVHTVSLFMKRLPLVIGNIPKEEQKAISFFIDKNLAELEVPLLLITRKEIEYGVNTVSATFANEKNQESRLSSIKMFSAFAGRGLL